MRKFDPSILFERWKPDPKLAVYRNPKSELDAVRDGAKPLSRTSLSWDDIADGKQLVELIDAAFARGLAVTLYNRAVHAVEPTVYVLPLDQTWRISALHALWDTAFRGGAWTFAAEDQESLLLGYTPEQRTRWIASRREEQIGYGCKTLYVLLDGAQREIVESVGKRCLGPATALEGMALFFHPDRHAVKRDAAKLVPRELTLARLGLTWKSVEKLFGPLKAHSGMVRAVLTKRLARIAIEATRSEVQFLTRKGWS